MDITWKKEYETGISSIDNQHKRLFEILEQIKDCTSSSTENSDFLLNALNDLAEYGTEHFKHEESVMSAGNFPDLEEHINIHNHFFTEVAKYRERYAEGLISNTEVLVFATNWLKQHILQEDHKYKKYFTETSFTHN